MIGNNMYITVSSDSGFNFLELVGYIESESDDGLVLEEVSEDYVIYSVDTENTREGAMNILYSLIYMDAVEFKFSLSNGINHD